MSCARARLLADLLRRDTTAFQGTCAVARIGQEDSLGELVIGNYPDILNINGNIQDVYGTETHWGRQLGLLEGDAPPATVEAFLDDVAERDNYPDGAVSLELFLEQREKLAAAVEAMDDERLDEVVVITVKGEVTRAQGIGEILHHAAYHAGQMEGMMKFTGTYKPVEQPAEDAA